MSVNETPLTKQTLGRTTSNFAAIWNLKKVSKRKELKSLCCIFFVEC